MSDMTVDERAFLARPENQRPVRGSAWRFRGARNRVARLVEDAPRHIRTRWQLLTRGWADTDVWHLDNVICERLGKQLAHLASISHGHPGDRTPEEWDAQLRAASQALLTWRYLDYDKVTREEEDRRYAKAKQALHWCADNLGHLWD